MSMKLFFADSAVKAEPQDVVVSDRYLDASGRPVAWKLRAISEELNEEIRSASTKRTKGKGSSGVPELDYNAYLGRMVAACVVYPDLNDAELQQSYGVRGASSVVRKMLLAGEFANLAAKVQEINGFDRDVSEISDEVKN
ncbi:MULTISPECIES: phage portal protein [unclassified Paenibacillus]|uniref:phage tail assembly chaperone n=1 Tax=unclassified Paenibacillus TaxID=185978 RepID=UPI00095484D5|nr:MULTISPECIES: phage portal protein [unclassified Paenibacillus]ASS66477.1 phage portal protein [Paenibacillus sp. RUD330]SIQ03184.1 Phage XkdN-like tail assembly chaperone protein, TAC [Paenibacillus sp. RU4X]SIQ22850.1 Phage XkdN-like tail assembly chaperone protein, TAC [Paenibacillus sp. RU4T]